jgi:hypothetical protein
MIQDPLDDQALSARAADLVDLARRFPADMSDRQRIAGLQALRLRLSERRRRAARWRWIGAGVGAALGAAATVCVVLFLHGHGASLTMRVDGGVLRPGGAIEASGTARPVVRFSDGSEIVLGADARLHVDSINEQGAHLTLDRGEAHVYVVHAPGARWTFDAGPFAVAVHGTAFGLAWRDSEQRLDVRLENGAVTVSGPASDAPLSLRAGQWLTVRESEVRIRSLSSEDPFEPTPALPRDLRQDASPVGPSASAAGVDGFLAPTSRRTREPAGRAEAPSPVVREPSDRTEVSGRHGIGRTWSADLVAGRFQSIVDEATAAGIDETFAQVGGSELAALADAARYTRRPSIARGALLAQRRRFAGSEHARTAAFDLGRIAESEQDGRGALSWFDVYLAEAPQGTYASEALGRKIVLTQRLDGNAAARPLADAYLMRFPAGAYAEAARALIGTP